MANKYNNSKIELDGYTFDSKAEARFYLKLKEQKERGEISGYQCHPRYVLLEPFTKHDVKYRGIFYEADFIVHFPNGKSEIIDVKGVRTATYQMKRQLFEDKYPHLSIKEI